MPLRILLPSNPGSNLSHRRHSSIVEGSPSASMSYVAPTCTRSRGSSLKRLSLSLSPTNEEPFPPLLPHETEPPSARRTSTQPDVSSNQEGAQKSASSPTDSPTRKNEEGQRNETFDDLSELPPFRPQGRPLLGLRHASDPQLSSRYRRGDVNEPKKAPRTCPLFRRVPAIAKPVTSTYNYHNRPHYKLDG